MRPFVLLALILAVPGCDGQKAPEPAKVSPAVAQATAAPCATSGVLACRIAPVDSLDGACAQLRECLSGIPRDKDDALQITSCNTPPAQTRLAAAAAPLEALAVISVDLQQGVAPSHAAYVLAKDARGWCPSAELLEPLWRHGGQCEAIVRLGADGAGAAVRAERICRMPLDRGEREAGVSDEAEHECVEARYALAGGLLKEASRKRSEGACPAG